MSPYVLSNNMQRVSDSCKNTERLTIGCKSPLYRHLFSLLNRVGCLHGFSIHFMPLLHIRSIDRKCIRLYASSFHLTWPGQICFLYSVYIHVQQGKTRIDIRAIRNIDFELSKCACSFKLKGALCTATHRKLIRAPG